MSYEQSIPTPADGEPDGHVTSADPTGDFLAFHHANPIVYRTCKRLAFEWLDAGKSKCGFALFYNQCRWVLSLAVKGDGVFELNNNHAAFYARALMHFEPELRGLFELRKAPAADAWIASVRRAEIDGMAA